MADSPLEDLEIMDKRTVENHMQLLEQKITQRIQVCLKNPKYCMYHPKKVLWWGEETKRSTKTITMGRILHLDGDSCLDNKNSH